VRAMVLEEQPGRLHLRDRPVRDPGPGEVLLRVAACGLCRTDLHIVDGELTDPVLPLVPGHQIVGRVEALGDGVEGIAPGERLGVSWLGWSCGRCGYCREGRENLCPEARFTGYHRDGGFAEHAVADARFTFPLPGEMGDTDVAPLLCGGLIGYRALRMAGEGRRIGLYGFGSAAHILTRLMVHQEREVYAFTRPGDDAGQRFAREVGVAWAGGSDEAPPAPLDAAIIFAPAGELVPAALRAVRPGGTVVCGGIHMSDIPSLPYALLWGERVLRSVANLTRRDGEEFLALAAEAGIRTTVRTFPLEEANEALDALRAGEVKGSLVLVP
jgi:alcohol dehydrogenase, propanol-preferring